MRIPVPWPVLGMLAQFGCHHPRNINAGEGCEGYRIIDDTVLLFDDTLLGAQASTFRCIENEYSTDGQHVYFSAKRMPGIDAASFKVLPHGYSKDDHAVYFGYYTGDTIPGAEPTSFEVIDLSFSKDRNAVYYWAVTSTLIRSIPADPLTFHKAGDCYMDRDHLYNVYGEVEMALDTTSTEFLEALCSDPGR